MRICKIILSAILCAVLISSCYSKAESKSADTPSTTDIDPLVEDVGRFTLISAGNRVVKLDTKTGKAWILESNSKQWQQVSDQRVGKYNPVSREIEWEPTNDSTAGTRNESATATATSTSDPLGLFTPEENAERARKKQQ